MEESMQWRITKLTVFRADKSGVRLEFLKNVQVIINIVVGSLERWRMPQLLIVPFKKRLSPI